MGLQDFKSESKTQWLIHTDISSSAGLRAMNVLCARRRWWLRWWVGRWREANLFGSDTTRHAHTFALPAGDLAGSGVVGVQNRQEKDNKHLISVWLTWQRSWGWFYLCLSPRFWWKLFTFPTTINCGKRTGIWEEMYVFSSLMLPYWKYLKTTFQDHAIYRNGWFDKVIIL